MSGSIEIGQFSHGPIITDRAPLVARGPLRWSGSGIDAKITHIETGAETASTPHGKYAANLPTHA
jgi:hypothetical protein